MSYNDPQTALTNASARFHGFLLNISMTRDHWLHFTSWSKKDQIWVKVLVALVGLACLAETVVLWCIVDIIYVKHLYDEFASANRSSYPESERLLGVSTALATIIAVLVQAYFARRAFLVLNKSIIFAVSIITLLLFVLGSGLYLSHLIWKRIWSNAIEVSAVSLYSSCVLVDLINTVVLLWRLAKFRNRTEFQVTRSIILRYILIIINSSSVSTALAIATLVSSRVTKVEYYMVFYEPLSKIYALSLMIQLVTRSSSEGVTTGKVSRGPISTSSKISRQQPTTVVQSVDLSYGNEEKAIPLDELTQQHNFSSYSPPNSSGIKVDTHTVTYHGH